MSRQDQTLLCIINGMGLNLQLDRYLDNYILFATSRWLEACHVSAAQRDYASAHPAK